MIDDAWLSLVERCVRDAEVAGSNPVASTYYSHLFEVAFLVPAAGAARTSGAEGPGGPGDLRLGPTGAERRPQVRILSHRLITATSLRWLFWFLRPERRPQVRILSHRLIIEGVKYGEVPLPEKIFSKLTQKT